jgi:hypothetical protein
MSRSWTAGVRGTVEDSRARTDLRTVARLLPRGVFDLVPGSIALD